MPTTKQFQGNATDKARKNKVALKAFFNIAKLWNLNNDEQMILLGMPPKTTFFRWKKNGVATLTTDRIERISYLLGIYKDLNILFTSPEQANSWIRRNNDATLFSGKSALAYLLHGKMKNLFEVRSYLDAQRG